MKVRLDKYLWAIRLYKTRSIASAEIKKGRVNLNQNKAKASSSIQVNDILQIQKDGIQYSYKILQILDKRVGAKLVSEYVLNITSKEELDKKEQQNLIHKAYRKSLQDGKPSKKDKRDLKKFLEN